MVEAMTLGNDLVHRRDALRNLERCRDMWPADRQKRCAGCKPEPDARGRR